MEIKRLKTNSKIFDKQYIQLLNGLTKRTNHPDRLYNDIHITNRNKIIPEDAIIYGETKGTLRRK